VHYGAGMGLRVPRLEPLSHADLPLLARWLSNPELSRYYTEPGDPAHVRAKYGPRIDRAARATILEPGAVVPCLALLGDAPIGYGQYYLHVPGKVAQWQLEARWRWGGFDLFIGEPSLWGCGIGLQLVAALLERLLASGATAAAVDTWVENRRAMRCYQKAGMRPERLLPRQETWQGRSRDHWLMVWTPSGGPGCAGAAPAPDGTERQCAAPIPPAGKKGQDVPLITCPGCGQTLESRDLAPSERFLASGECWALYCELAAYDMARRESTFLHQEAVDAYEAQHAGGPATKNITAVFALVGLYLWAELGFTGRQVQQAHMALGRQRRAWPRWDPPGGRCGITVGEVLQGEPGEARDELIRQWARAVWQAWRFRHEDVRELCRQLLRMESR